jgi:parvulin-like peptidyl-prolyl isomerase
MTSFAAQAASVLRGRSGGVLLLVGALTGVLLAATGVVERDDSSALALGDEVVATVNGVPIRRLDYNRALAAVATDRRDGRVNDVMREHVLDRLIDEELLLQRGLELGLARSVPNLRTNLSTAVIDLITARNEDGAGDDEAAYASEDELRAFYTSNAAYFRHSPRLHVDALLFGVTAHSEDQAALERAKDARRRLESGEASASVRHRADPQTVAVPAVPLPLAKLREYLGPTVARGIASLESGAVSEPLRSGSGYFVVRIVARENGELPAFDLIHEQVRAEYERRSSERRLREFLDSRRSQADVRIAESRS